LLLGSLLSVWNPARPLFRPGQEVETFQYLAETAAPGEVVLGSFETSNPLPAWAPLWVMTGHGPESANGAEMRAAVEHFFSAEMSETERLAMLDRFGVGYVIWGPAERSLGDWDPLRAGYLAPVFETGPYLILRRTAAP
jgi:hypothetical protein